MRRKICIFLTAVCVIVATGCAWADVAINPDTFPDPVFGPFMFQFDTNGDGTLSNSEIANIKELYIGWMGISSLQGIEYLTAIEVLYCDGNPLNTLDVSKNTKLRELGCWQCGLTSLNVKGCKALEKLNAQENQLTRLDVSGYTALLELFCAHNGMTSLNVSGCTALKTMNCEGNQLSALDVSTCTRIIDLNFAGNFLTSINLSKCTALKYLNCPDNQLSALDVTACKKLEILNCDRNREMTTLNVSGCTALREIECNECQLSTLNVSGFANLTSLGCNGNRISSLNLSNCKSLLILYCENNGMTSLNVSGCTSLAEMKCNANQLATLDVTSCKALQILECADNQLQQIDLSKCTALKLLGCWNNQLTALDVTKCTRLLEIWCATNQITALNVTKCTHLMKLDCDGNQIKTLNASKCTDLLEMWCESNQLTSLNVTGCKALTKLDCDWNQLQALDVSTCKALRDLSCEGNQIATINVSGCTSLTRLQCSNNQLRTLDASKCTALLELFCYVNQLETLDISGCKSLRQLNCNGGPLTHLDVSKKTALRFVQCRHNQLQTINANGCTSLMGIICNANPLQAIDLTGCPKDITVAYDGDLPQVSKPTIFTEYIPDATRRAPYSFMLAGLGGTTSRTWTMTKGSLPDGLKLTASTGKITGTPTKAGSFNFTIQYRDSTGASATREYTMNVTQTEVWGDVPETATRRSNYWGGFGVGGGTEPYTWSIHDGKLPDGLKINSKTGEITGTPTVAGTFTFTVKAKDINGAAGKKTYTIRITQTKVTGSIPATITRRAAYTGSPKASEGAEPYVWSISEGKLPDGLKISSKTGKITGTPTKAGTFTFTVKTKDTNGAAGKKSYTIKVTQTAVSGTLANATKGSSYTGTPKVSGGASPYVWSISAGSLPDGLKINTSTGKITGTPTKTGTFTFTVKAKDKNGAAGTKSFTVKVTTSTTTAKSLPESKSGTKNTASVSTQGHSSVSALPATFTATEPQADGITSANLPASLRVKSDDILKSFDGKDSDIVIVKAGMPVRFILGEEISGASVYVDDKPAKGVEISDEGTFTLPAEIVRDDFKVCVKSSDGAKESEELYITAE